MKNSDEIIEIYLNSATTNAFSSEYTSDAVFYIPNIKLTRMKKL